MNMHAMTSHCETSSILKITFAQSNSTIQSIISPPAKKTFGTSSILVRGQPSVGLLRPNFFFWIRTVMFGHLRGSKQIPENKTR